MTFWEYMFYIAALGATVSITAGLIAATVAWLKDRL